MHTKGWSLLLLAAGAAACGGGDGGGPGPMPAQIVRSAGDNQVGPAGQALGTALEVTVLDASGAPLANIPVAWAAASGGGSVAPTSAMTGSDGKVTATRTLGPTAGAQTTTATVSGIAPTTFTHVAQVQGATQIQLNGGNNQSDTVLATLGTPLSVLVREQNNAPVQGVMVTWTASGSAKVNGSPTATVATDATGVAVVTYTLGGNAVPLTPTASVTGLIGSPVTFNITATAGNAHALALSAGDSQCGQPSSPLATPHSVIVTDQNGNPTPGVQVDWVVGEGGGTVNPTQSTTNASGIASTTRTVGAGAGTYTDTAKVVGVVGTVPFTATVSTTIVDVSVSNSLTFVSQDVTVPRCGTVRWTWAGGVTHNVTFESSALGTGSGNQNAGTFDKVFDVAAGVYRYRCTIHSTSFTSGMIGTVTVQ
jgi:plastocyanin